MKKLFLLIILLPLLNTARAQVLCIFCYNQNNGVAPGNANNFILNGGFENSPCDTEQVLLPASGYYECDLPNWTFTGGNWASYPKLYNNSYTMIPEGSKGLYLGNYFCRVCGDTYNDVSCLQAVGCAAVGPPSGFPQSEAAQGGSTGVSVEQTVTGLTSGTDYVLEFWAGGEWNYTIPGLFAVDVGYGDTLLRNQPTHPDSGVGTRYLIVFRANSASHTIKFTNWGHSSAASTEVVLDDISLYLKSEIAATCVTTGIDEHASAKGPVAYPNPAYGEITIKLRDNTTRNLMVYDVFARKLVQEPINGSTTINISQWPTGMYFYQIQETKGHIENNGRFTKE